MKLYKIRHKIGTLLCFKAPSYLRWSSSYHLKAKSLQHLWCIFWSITKQLFSFPVSETKFISYTLYNVHNCQQHEDYDAKSPYDKKLTVFLNAVLLIRIR